MMRGIAWVLSLVCLLVACASGAAPRRPASPSASVVTDNRIEDASARRPSGKCGSKRRAIDSGHQTREYNRCRRCGRPRAYYRKFGICRICLREAAHEGYIPGMTKSSW